MAVHYQWYAVQMLILVNHHGHAPLVVLLMLGPQGSASTRVSTILPLRQGNGMSRTLSCGVSSCTMGIKEVCDGLYPLNSSRTILLLGLWFIT